MEGGWVRMERKVVVVCAVVGFLGVLSAALGFAAEGTRVKVRFSSQPQSLISGEPPVLCLAVPLRRGGYSPGLDCLVLLL